MDIHLDDVSPILKEKKKPLGDDEYLYRHDMNRLYLAMTICISNEIQFLRPAATATTCGITLWTFSNNHLFGTAYKDILIAMDKVRG